MKKFKKIGVEKNLALTLKQYCKDRQMTMSDFLELLINKEVDSKIFDKNLDKKDFAEIAIPCETADKFRYFCKSNNYDPQGKIGEIIEQALQDNLSITKLLSNSK